MVAEYLEKIRQEMYEYKLCIEREYKNKVLLLKENEQFTAMLEDSLDKNYESFSPRDVNHESYEKIDKLKKERAEIKQEKEELEEKILNINNHLEELDSVLQYTNKNEKVMLSVDEISKAEEIFRKKILETQEMERKRIARELHDSIVQSLTSIIHKVELCTKLMDMDTVRCKLELQTMSKTVKKIIEDMRQVIYNLRPMSLDDIGLEVTLEREAAKWKNTGKVLVDYQIEGEKKKIPPLVSLTILRIVQEACNNILKHAQADHIDIILTYKENSIKVQIVDDGCGFDVESMNQLHREDGSGFGLSMMRERVYLLSGNLSIESVIGKGTTISVEIPIDKEEK